MVLCGTVAVAGSFGYAYAEDSEHGSWETIMGETIAAGGLEFHVENRAVAQDGGPSMQVYGTVDGERVQLLRFDMFQKIPHYHYAPMGANLRYDLDQLTLDDGIGWTMGMLATKLPQMIAKAGYEKLAAAESLRDAVSAVPEIERRWRAQRPL